MPNPRPWDGATREQSDDPCPHDAWTGDEGPAREHPPGWIPSRWKCDGCGVVRVGPDPEPTTERNPEDQP